MIWCRHCASTQLTHPYRPRPRSPHQSLIITLWYARAVDLHAIYCLLWYLARRYSLPWTAYIAIEPDYTVITLHPAGLHQTPLWTGKPLSYRLACCHVPLSAVSLVAIGSNTMSWYIDIDTIICIIIIITQRRDNWPDITSPRQIDPSPECPALQYIPPPGPYCMYVWMIYIYIYTKLTCTQAYRIEPLIDVKLCNQGMSHT